MVGELALIGCIFAKLPHGSSFAVVVTLEIEELDIVEEDTQSLEATEDCLENGVEEDDEEVVGEAEVEVEGAEVVNVCNSCSGCFVCVNEFQGSEEVSTTAGAGGTNRDTAGAGASAGTGAGKLEAGVENVEGFVASVSICIIPDAEREVSILDPPSPKEVDGVAEVVAVVVAFAGVDIVAADAVVPAFFIGKLSKGFIGGGLPPTRVVPPPVLALEILLIVGFDVGVEGIPDIFLVSLRGSTIGAGKDEVSDAVAGGTAVPEAGVGVKSSSKASNGDAMIEQGRSLPYLERKETTRTSTDIDFDVTNKLYNAANEKSS